MIEETIILFFLLAVVKNALVSIRNRHSVLLEHLYQAQDGLDINIDIFNHYIYQYINERFDGIHLDLVVRPGFFTGVDREVYIIRQEPDIEHMLFIKVYAFFWKF